MEISEHGGILEGENARLGPAATVASKVVITYGATRGLCTLKRNADGSLKFPSFTA